MKTSKYLLLTAAALTFGISSSNAMAAERAADQPMPGQNASSVLAAGTVARIW